MATWLKEACRHFNLGILKDLNMFTAYGNKYFILTLSAVQLGLPDDSGGVLFGGLLVSLGSASFSCGGMG